MPKTVLKISCPGCDNKIIQTFQCNKCSQTRYIDSNGDISCSCYEHKKIWELQWKCECHQNWRKASKFSALDSLISGFTGIVSYGIESALNMTIYDDAMKSVTECL